MLPLDLLKNKKILIVIGSILVIILLYSSLRTSYPKNLINYMKESFNKEYIDTIKKYEEEKSMTEAQLSYLREQYIVFEGQKKTLEVTKNKLLTENNKLKEDLNTIQGKIKDVKTPQNKQEASQTLNSLGYINTIKSCQ